MRPLSSLVKWMSVSSLVLVVLAITNLAPAQSGSSSKRKLTQHGVPVASVAKAAKRQAPPPVTTETWQGGASGNWSLATNWNNGAITSGDNILINLTTAGTTDDVSYTIGTLTLSNAGDSVGLNNNVQTTVTGNILNNGTITMNATGNVTELYMNNALTLSGTGSIVLTSSSNQYTGQLSGVAGTVLTNSSNITGAGIVGATALNFINSGTMNANINGKTLAVNPDACGTCTNTNTGTLEASGGGVLSGRRDVDEHGRHDRGADRVECISE